MKKIIVILAAAAAIVSCRSLIEEWQPVLGDAPVPEKTHLYSDEDLPEGAPAISAFKSIKDLKALYKGKPLELSGKVWIKGQVVSSDVTGNIYRELYIQDATGGIDLKLGKSSLYSDYALGQTIYVYCDGLTLGAYNGMPQLGMEADQTSTNEYETSYIDVQAIIDGHVFKGQYGTPIPPVVVSAAEIEASISAGFNGELWGKLVTVKGLTYGSASKGVKEIFALFYPNPNLPHKSGNPENRVFLSTPLDKKNLKAGFNYTWGVDTWACSKAAYISYLESGVWDEAEVGSGNTHYGTIAATTPKSAGLTGKTLDSFEPDTQSTYKQIMIKNASANYIAHYFKIGSTDVQVRTSGYAKFADVKLDPKIISGSTVDITGIMTI
ncbi:MAG: DUF5689 domain-containing protein, partial [Bacteroidales bacterium]|nr:DUF5689 domain-containing protein [Bacteroidales bacterium]